MTTWDEEANTLDFHSWLFRKTPKDFELVEKILTKVPIQLASPIDAGIPKNRDLQSHEAVKILFPKYGENKNPYMAEQIMNFCNKYAKDKIYTTINAIYRIFGYCWNEKMRYVKEHNFKKLFETQDQFVEYEAMLSNSTPKRVKFIKEVCGLQSGMRHYYTRYMSLSSTFAHMGYFHRAASYSDLVQRAKRENSEWPICKFMDLGPGWNVRLFESTVCLERTYDNEAENELFFLETKSLRRLIMLLRSTAKLAVYYANAVATTNDHGPYNAWLKYMTELSSSMFACKRSNEIARAYDIAMFVYIARESSDITERSLEDQKAKFAKGSYDEIVSATKICSIVSSLGFMDAIDVLKTYKILPCPDFDSSTGFISNTKFYEQQWSFGVIPKEFEHLDLQISEQDFRDYQKLQVIRRYYSVNLECPGWLTQSGIEYVKNNPSSLLSAYPYVQPSDLKINMMNMINIKGAGDWKAWNMNEPDHYNDKSCPPQFIDMNKIQDASQFQDLKIEHRSFLGFYMSQTSVPHGDVLRWTYEKGNYKHCQRAHFKPESKKPDPRNFFSAPPYARLMRAEFESNIARYLDVDNSSVTGKTPHDSAKLLQDLMFTTRADTKRVFISFDLEKFSPKMPLQTSRCSNDIWMELFDQPYMSQVHKMFENTELHYIHEGIHQKYTTKFADFEGQLGKANTAFHIDLMAYTVRQLKKKKLVDGPGSLLALIDDGLLGINVPIENFKQNVRQIMEVIDAVYTFFGLRISWDKTFVSSKFSMFLNEIWYKGNRYTGGVKAFLKMQPQKVLDELSFSGRVKGLVAMAQGAVKAGLDPHIACTELFRETYILLEQHMRRNTLLKHSEPKQICMFLITPIGLGGIGLPVASTLIGTIGSTPVDVFVDQIAYIIGCFPALTNNYLPIVSQSVRSRKNAAILRAPMAIRRSGSTLTEWKHVDYVIDYVRENANSKYAKAIFSINAETTATSVLSMLPQSVTIEEISTAYRASMLGALDKFLGKFKRSSTLMQMMKVRARALILGRYASELARVYEETTKVLPRI